MTDGNGTKRLGVYAVVEKDADGNKKFWPKIGVAFVNRDGSMSLLLDALPLGTNKLQVREIRDEARGAASASPGPRRNGFDVVEVRP